MQTSTPLSDKKNIIIEVVVLCMFLGAMYYGYTVISEQSPVTTTSSDQALFGPNLTLLIKAVEEDHIVLSNPPSMSSELPGQLKDFSEEIPKVSKYGRDNPFIPK